MVSLEQIRALEARVEKAVDLIDRLRKENADLDLRLSEAVKAEEQARASAAEFERMAAASARTAAESASRLGEVAGRAQVAEDKAAQADLRAADALERASVAERRAQAADSEAAIYRDRALGAERKASELEARAEELRRDQSRIEDGLAHALEKLDAFEDMVLGRQGADLSAAVDAAPQPAETAGWSATGTEGAGLAPSGGAAASDSWPDEMEGDAKEGEVDESRSAGQSPESTFPGTEHELDIF